MEEKIEQEEKDFRNCDELMLALTKLRHDETSMDDIMSTCKQLASIFQRASWVDIDRFDQQEITAILKLVLGVSGPRDLSHLIDKSKTVSEMASMKGSVSLPMTMLSNLVDQHTTNDFFNIAISYVAQDGKDSLLNTWLNNQNTKERTLGDE